MTRDARLLQVRCREDDFDLSYFIYRFDMDIASPNRRDNSASSSLKHGQILRQTMRVSPCCTTGADFAALALGISLRCARSFVEISGKFPKEISFR